MEVCMLGKNVGRKIGGVKYTGAIGLNEAVFETALLLDEVWKFVDISKTSPTTDATATDARNPAHITSRHRRDITALFIGSVAHFSSSALERNAFCSSKFLSSNGVSKETWEISSIVIVVLASVRSTFMRGLMKWHDFERVGTV